MRHLLSWYARCYPPSCQQASPRLTSPPRASRQKFSTSQLGAGVFGIYPALHNPATAISFQDLDDVREVACSMQEGASRPGNAAQMP